MNNDFRCSQKSRGNRKVVFGQVVTEFHTVGAATESERLPSSVEFAQFVVAESTDHGERDEVAAGCSRSDRYDGVNDVRVFSRPY